MDEKLVHEFNPDKFLPVLQENFTIGKQYYSRVHKKMQMLNSTDNGDLWKAIRAKFPPYQILPDTNWVSFIKKNLLASLYTVAKSAQLVPTSEEDVEICEVLNVALEHDWDKNDVAYYQYMAGERAALLNLGLTQVSWDEEKKNVKYENIDPLHFMRDPFSDCLENAGWCVYYNSYHKTIFDRDSRYKEKFREYIKSSKGGVTSEQLPEYRERQRHSDNKEYYNLFIWWIKCPEGHICEIHTLNNEVVLFSKEKILPNMFPFAELYCNLPSTGSLVGTSEPAKIFANNLVYNLMDSIAFTSEYKNQRPPKFVSTQSGLNIKAFAKHGAEADRTFVVNGDATRAVHYHQFPTVSNQLPNLMANLANNMQQTSGVDGKYTGRDTGSIITTGGTEEMLNRVTLIDTPMVLNYERYTRQLTELTLKIMLHFAPKRTYIVKDEENSTQTKVAYKSVEIDFPKIPNESVFEYAIQISSELPKNKQRVQAWANNMMEKQMQYNQQGLDVDIITPEEWIRFQDVPYKEQMLKRMGIQTGLNAYMEAQNVIADYASMLDAGALPEDAMAMTAEAMRSRRAGEPSPIADNAMPGMGDNTNLADLSAIM